MSAFRRPTSEVGETRLIASVLSVRVRSGYVLLEIVISLSIMAIIGGAVIGTASRNLERHQSRGMLSTLFHTAHYARSMAKAYDRDVIMKARDRCIYIESSEGSERVSDWPFSFKKDVKTGFKGSGNTKYSGTMTLSSSDTGSVSVGVGYGKISIH